jgi:hypothetical protein
MEPTTAAVRPAANNPRREIDTCPSSFFGGSEGVGEEPPTPALGGVADHITFSIADARLEEAFRLNG